MISLGYLTFQDRASLLLPRRLKSIYKKGSDIIDARAGCGTRIAQLSVLVGKQGKVFAFEHRPGRLETLKTTVKLLGCTSTLN